MKKNLPAKIGKFLLENKESVLTVMDMKIRLFQTIIDYKKTKQEIAIREKEIELREKEVEKLSLIELQKIKSDTEKVKKEYETMMKNREYEHKEIMKKLDMIAYQLKEGNEIIKEIISENKKDIIKNNSNILNDFYKFQLEVAKLLKDL